MTATSLITSNTAFHANLCTLIATSKFSTQRLGLLSSSISNYKPPFRSYQSTKFRHMSTSSNLLSSPLRYNRQLRLHFRSSSIASSSSSFLRYQFKSSSYTQGILVCFFSTDSTPNNNASNSSAGSSSSLPNAPNPSTSANPNTTSTAIAPSRWQRIKTKVVDEARHYWLGTKLLWTETKIAGRLMKDVLHGRELTRRERKQLVRTSADLLRLIPFAMIVVVPFAELALPILLKLFPNLLPSTYLDHKGEEAKLKKEIAAKVGIAQFLQETTQLMADQLLEKVVRQQEGDEKLHAAQSFTEFMSKVRRGESVTNEEILHFASLFDEDFTLEHLSRLQLKAICKLLNIRDIGSDWVLKYKIDRKLRDIREDDREIKKEGIDKLSTAELIEACRARGIHPGQTPVYMRKKLSDWIELSFEKNIPISLLVLSRAFSAKLAFRPTEELASTLKYIPESVVSDAHMQHVDLSENTEEKLKLLHSEEAEKYKEREKKRASIPTAPNVIGLTEVREQLEELKEDNDEIEEYIDEVTAPTTSTTAVEAKKTTILPPLQATEREREREPEDIKVKKSLKKVDKLNDRVEALIKDIENDIKKVEKEDK